MPQQTGAASIAAALILSTAVVAGALLVRSSVQEAGREVAGLKEALEALPRPDAAPARADLRGGRPDPGRRYSVKTEGSPARGPESAKVSVVEFSDFQCPFCGRVNPTLNQITSEYGEDVRIVFKHLPLSIHPKAPEAHRAAEAAHRQGRFWEMHDRIFADQRGMSSEKYREYAREIGLDMERFEKDMADPALAKKVQADADEAARLGVTGTPGFFINGRFLSGAQPFAAFESLIDEELGRS